MTVAEFGDVIWLPYGCASIYRFLRAGTCAATITRGVQQALHRSRRWARWAITFGFDIGPSSVDLGFRSGPPR